VGFAGGTATKVPVEAAPGLLSPPIEGSFCRFVSKGRRTSFGQKHSQLRARPQRGRSETAESVARLQRTEATDSHPRDQLEQGDALENNRV
jgi:hypothetical protein